MAFGGPNSTLVTLLAWEYDGPDRATLNRVPSAHIPLRFSGMSDASDPRLHDYHFRFVRADGSEETEVPWGYLDTNGPPVFPSPSGRPIDRVNHDGKMIDVYKPLDNYMVVNKVPNFIDPEKSGGPASWARLVTFQGSNGIGTRASELLLTPAGLDVLREIKRQVGHATAFQALLRVSGRETGRDGRDQFTRIEPIRIAELKIKDGAYAAAENDVMLRLPRLAKMFVGS